MPDIKPGEIGTVIGSDASFKGELTFEGGMRIDGRFEGKLDSKGRLTIGKNAQVAGEVAVGQVSIEGTLKGNAAAAERIELTSTAQVLGDVRAPRLVVAEGATFVGNCHVSPDALKTAAAPVAQAPAQAPVFRK